MEMDQTFPKKDDQIPRSGSRPSIKTEAARMPPKACGHWTCRADRSDIQSLH
jgi:hypothetical protein